MKKQINPTIKAHLIRGAFYLLLLVAVCAIPFALAQRNKLSSTKAPPTKAQKAAASGKVFQSGAPGALAGRAAARKPSVGQNALPYDIRRLPGVARFSSATHTGRKPFGPRTTRLLRSLLPNSVYMLDDGSAEDGVGFGNGAQNFESLWMNQFNVISGQTMITTVSVAWGTPLFPDPSNNGTPVTIAIWSDPNGDGSPTDAVLLGSVAGTIQNEGTDTFVNYTFNPPVDVSAFTSFFVGDMTPMNGGPEHFYQGLDETPPSHMRSWIAANGDGSAVDINNVGNNDLIGTIDSFGLPGNWLIRADTGAPGSPTPTPTGTPSGCSDYTTSTGSGTITPGDTDTGNHCDDCATLISFPFPVSVYGQTFNSANVGSNGSLDLIGTQTPFTHGCLVLPNTLWDMAILPYQDDLRTDNISFAGCNVFPGATCGIFTSVTGTAPNRQFNIEWRATHFADTTTSANFEVVFYENQSSFFDIFYGATSDNGLDETSGVQASAAGPATTFSCGTATLTDGLQVTYTCAGGGGSPTPTPTGTPGNCTVNGSIDTSDPVQTDRLFRSGFPQTCPASTSCAIFGDGLPRHYDSYTFTNTTGASQCVTIDTNTACTGTNFIFTAAYLGSFDPNNICTNWIGDSGFSPNPDQPFQVDVADGQTFVVVVSEVTPDAGCAGYTVTITPSSICGGGGSPTPTPTCTGGGTPGPWVAGMPYPTTIVRYGFAQTATHFYVFGGVDNGFTTNAVNRMDLSTGNWESRAPMPFGDEAPTCALDESGGIVYCADGAGTNQFAAYNIAGNSWTSLAPDPLVPDHYGSASGFFNGQVFVVGGTSFFSNQLDVYNVGTNSWSAGTPAPVGPFLLAGYHQIGQFLYVVGGFDPGVVNYATTLRLDMSTGTWETGPAFTPQLGDFGLAYDPGTNKLYSLGGDLPNDGNFFNSTNQVNELDVSAWPGGTWTSSPPLLPAPNRQANQAGFYGNGDIWSVGGINGATFQFLAEVWHRNDGGACPSATPTATATATTPPPTPTATVTATATATIPPPTPTATTTATTPPPTATPTATASGTVPPRTTPTPRPRPTPAPRPRP